MNRRLEYTREYYVYIPKVSVLLVSVVMSTMGRGPKRALLQGSDWYKYFTGLRLQAALASSLLLECTVSALSIGLYVRIDSRGSH